MLVRNRKKLLFLLLLQNVNLYPRNSSLKVALKNLNCLFSLFWYLPLQHKYAMNIFATIYGVDASLLQHSFNIFTEEMYYIYVQTLYIKYILLNIPYNRSIKSILTCCNRHLLLLNMINFNRNALLRFASPLIIIVSKFNHQFKKMNL